MRDVNHCGNCGEYLIKVGPEQPWGRSGWCPSCAEDSLREMKNERDRLEKELAALEETIPEHEANIQKLKDEIKRERDEKARKEFEKSTIGKAIARRFINRPSNELRDPKIKYLVTCKECGVLMGSELGMLDASQIKHTCKRGRQECI